MWLHCDFEADAGETGAATRSWLRSETLDTLLELNELSLALLAEQAGARGAAACPLLRQVSELWRILDAPARRRAAGCPYLLLDGGFADVGRWRQCAQLQVGDAHGACTAFFTVPSATEVARLVFTYAWHLACAQPAAARLLLGMPPATAALIAQCTLRRIQALAESRREWLRPRWPARVEVWREVLLAAASGEGQALESARLRGLTLLAGEAWQAPPGASSSAVALVASKPAQGSNIKTGASAASAAPAWSSSALGGVRGSRLSAK